MTDPKPNIRPGVRGICHWKSIDNDGQWSTDCGIRVGLKQIGFLMEITDRCTMTWCPWCGREIEQIAIVEDLPTVPSQKQKSYWRLLEPGEFVTRGDEFIAGKTWCKTHSTQYGVKAGDSDIYRRRVTAPEPQSSNDITPKQFDEIGVLLEEIDELKADAAKWREHVANPQPAPQIPGMPEGWEVDPERKTYVTTVPDWMNIPIRRIKTPEPVCTWQHGVFRDGWIAEDKDTQKFWYKFEPIPEDSKWQPSEGICGNVDGAMLIASPKFRDDLPWDQRCVKVGPEAEKGLSCP